MRRLAGYAATALLALVPHAAHTVSTGPHSAPVYVKTHQILDYKSENGDGFNFSFDIMPQSPIRAQEYLGFGLSDGRVDVDKFQSVAGLNNAVVVEYRNLNARPYLVLKAWDKNGGMDSCSLSPKAGFMDKLSMSVEYNKARHEIFMIAKTPDSKASLCRVGLGSEVSKLDRIFAADAKSRKSMRNVLFGTKRCGFRLNC